MGWVYKSTGGSFTEAGVTLDVPPEAVSKDTEVTITLEPNITDCQADTHIFTWKVKVESGHVGALRDNKMGVFSINVPTGYNLATVRFQISDTNHPHPDAWIDLTKTVSNKVTGLIGYLAPTGDEESKLLLKHPA